MVSLEPLSVGELPTKAGHTHLSLAKARGQYLDVQELEAAQLPLVLQLTKGPIQGALPLPHHLLKLIGEMLDHLGHRK